MFEIMFGKGLSLTERNVLPYTRTVPPYQLGIYSARCIPSWRFDNVKKIANSTRVEMRYSTGDTVIEKLIWSISSGALIGRRWPGV
jgi:hypothetical protein